MPVALFTGLPGAGNTATLVKRILTLLEKEPGRPIFQFGIKGLKDGIAIPLTEEQLHHWWELPHGSIIAIDECQEDGSDPDQPVSLFPKDRGNPAAWVQKITKVRHFGIDFLLTTQNPANMSAYVRRLVDYHCHSVIRAKGVRQTFTWNRCIDDPDNRRDKKTSDMSFSPIPKDVFGLYESSALHTMKVRMPRKFLWLAAIAVVLVFLAWFIPHRIHSQIKPAGLAALKSASMSGAADKSLRVTKYAQWSSPRVAGIPWTAPMFDDLTVKASPRLFCAAVADGGCVCITEQGTDLDVPKRICRLIAAHGVYNPFIEPDSNRVHDHDEKKHGDRRSPASPAAGHRALSSMSMPAGGQDQFRAGVGTARYTPPELTVADHGQGAVGSP